VTELRSWFRENQTLVMFLGAQAIAIATAAAAILAYSVKLETRVSIMETRGAAYTSERLGKIDERLTVLEGSLKKTAAQVDRVVDIMTRGLPK